MISGMRCCPRLLLAVAVCAALMGTVHAQAQAERGLWAARAALAAGRYEDAERRFLVLQQGDPTRAQAQLGLGPGVARDRALRRGRAQRPTAVGATSGPLQTRAETLRGEALQARGKLDEAQAAFERPLRDPRALRARVLLGRLLLERGRPDRGRAASDGAGRGLQQRRARRRAGRVAVLRGDGRARARQRARRQRRLPRGGAEPTATRVETQLEWAALFLEKYDQRHADRERPGSARAQPATAREAHVLMARLLLARSFDFPAAEEHLQQALAVNPSLVRRLRDARRAGRCATWTSRHADRELDAALAINPNDLEALQRARGRALSGRRRAGLRAQPSARCCSATRASRACTASSPSTPSGSIATPRWSQMAREALAHRSRRRAGLRDARPQSAARGRRDRRPRRRCARPGSATTSTCRSSTPSTCTSR